MNVRSTFDAGRAALRSDAMDQLFLEARTYYGWLKRPVADETLRAVYDLAKMAPTATNSNPARIVFVRSQEAKERLRPGLKPGNVDKTMAAPVTAIIGIDTRFYEHMPRLAPHAVSAPAEYAADPDRAHRASFRNSTLQGAYMIIAARALGLDCGPMSGFLHDVVDAAFFPDGRVRSNFLLNLGYGDPATVRPRAYRFAFDEVCTIE